MIANFLDGMRTVTSNNLQHQSPAAARIAKTARELFFAEGYSAVTTDQLCKAAAVSKTSLYKYFGDMAGVLSAVVRIEGDSVSAGLIPEPRTVEEFWDSLTAYGRNLLTLLNQRDIVQLDRMLHEQARKHLEVSQSFYDGAYGRSHVELTAMIQFGKEQGFVKRPQPSEQLAENLFCMWAGLASVKTRLGLMHTPYPDPQTRARECVQMLFERDYPPGFVERSSTAHIGTV
jgi:TetR/AcrR family transcriptional regulator, mexJK operon transcriptional repressor